MQLSGKVPYKQKQHKQLADWIKYTHDCHTSFLFVSGWSLTVRKRRWKFGIVLSWCEQIYLDWSEPSHCSINLFTKGNDCGYSTWTFICIGWITHMMFCLTCMSCTLINICDAIYPNVPNVVNTTLMKLFIKWTLIL